MIGYKIMLVMLIFSAVCGGLNSLGWYANQKLPEQDATINQAQVTEFTQGVGKTSINPWTGYSVLSTFFNIGGSVLLSMLTIIPFLTAFGVDFQLALMIQTPIWFILVWTVYEIWTGHTTTMQE